MQKWNVEEIIRHARQYSPFYRELYLQLPDKLSLEDLPVIDQTDFWKSEVLTETPHGIVFKSGGSTGAPKYSYFSQDEWETFTYEFGQGMSKGILKNGDRIANLFYAGDLYASFLFIKDSFAAIRPEDKKITHFPIAGQTDHSQILKTLAEFNINVIVGVPSAIITMLEKYKNNRAQYSEIKVERILFGGEALYEDQRKALLEIFPQLEISSIGCASVDGGLLGYSSADCGPGEHRTFDGANIIEIIDPDSGKVIKEKGRTGKVLLTNLTRKLMPIIRYPAGDMAMWLEDEGSPDRKFILQGRSEEAARLGTLSVYFEDTREMVNRALPEARGIQFQLVLKHFDHKDEMTIRISVNERLNEKDVQKKILESFISEKIVYMDLVKKNLIHPLKIELVGHEKLESNVRTGKLKRIIDLRNA